MCIKTHNHNHLIGDLRFYIVDINVVKSAKFNWAKCVIQKTFFFQSLQEWRQIEPNVEVEPRSSNGSQKVPKLLTDEEEPQTKRRVKKRRRRPQLLQDETWFDDEEERPVFRKTENDWKPREQFSDFGQQSKRPAAERQKSAYRGSAIFKQVEGPKFSNNDPEEIMQTSEEPSKPVTNKAYRKQYSLKKLEDQRAAEEQLSPAAKLKAILKQSGGLSLSEVLQQKNVSLADLLKGKERAIAAVAATTVPRAGPDRKPPQYQSIESSESEQDDETNESELDEDEDDFETSSESHREQKEFRIRKNYGRPKKQPPTRVVESEPEDDDVRPTRRIPLFNPPRPKFEQKESSNQVENDSKEEDSSDSRERVFPTVEIKQMALNPVVPVDRGEKARIKNVIPKIRPDFSNSKSKNEESFENARRKAQPSKLTATSSVAPPPTTARDRWTPNGNRDRLPSRIPYRSTPRTTDVTSDSSVAASSVDNNDPPTTTPASTTRSVTRSTSTVSTTPKNIDVIRNRLSVKPRIRLPARPARIRTSSSTTETPVAETEKVEVLTTTLKEEPDVNVIEKFTSFEDAKPKNVESIEQIFPTRNERIPPSRIKKITEKSAASQQETSSEEKKLDIVQVTEVVLPSLLADLIGPNVEEEKNEIIQLLEDRRNGGKLVKVLEQRNMSVDELMEHRQRGSSHLHLTELLKNKRRLAELAKGMEDRVDIVTAFENFPKFDLAHLKSVQPDDIKTDSQGFSYFTSIINIRPTDEIYKEARALQDIATLEKVTKRQFKTLALPNRPAAAATDGVIQKMADQRSTAPTAPTDETILQHIEQELKRAVESELKPTVTIENTNGHTSSGIKSAIFASTCIVAVSLMVFVLIFAVFRWRQRCRNKLNYTESYKIAKGRLPIMQQAQHHHNKDPRDNNLSPVLCAKHRHSSRLMTRMGTMDPNSPEIHDYLGWDHMKKPFQ